jgi:betaine-aldehyde dehydrogenase
MPYATQPTASHFIDGTYVEDTAGTPIPVIYPATGEEIATVHAGTPAIVDRALAAARAAQPEWAAMSPATVAGSSPARRRSCAKETTICPC